LHRWATAFWYPVSQSGTEAFQYRTGSPASDGLGYTLYVNIVGGEKEYAVHPACHTAGGEKNPPCTSTLLVVVRDTSCMSMLLAADRDTPCVSILLAVERDTPCTSTLLAVERIHPARSYCWQ